MPATTDTDQRIHAMITELIPLIEDKVAAIEAQGTPKAPPRGAPGDVTAIDLMDLETLIVRLQQVKTWLEEGDPAFQAALRQHVTDDNTRNQRRESRRDWTMAVVTTFVGAMLGWLSSLAATPVTLWHHLVR